MAITLIFQTIFLRIQMILDVTLFESSQYQGKFVDTRNCLGIKRVWLYHQNILERLQLAYERVTLKIEPFGDDPYFNY